MTRAMRTIKYVFHSRYCTCTSRKSGSKSHTTLFYIPGEFVVQVHAVVIDCTQKFFYMADFGLIYTCSSCKNITRAKPREKIVLRIFDSSGFLDATSFGSQAAAITGVDCIDCMDIKLLGLVLTNTPYISDKYPNIR
ncbi:hypothetical protein ACJIZ3_006156 [Penstemon smallii]|uniref:Uncharacterized protein n=1 Tax=Penstemon smallii TaxID=265156 RepID=A0ABD3S6V9_9LAMI